MHEHGYSAVRYVGHICGVSTLDIFARSRGHSTRSCPRCATPPHSPRCPPPRRTSSGGPSCPMRRPAAPTRKTSSWRATVSSGWSDCRWLRTASTTTNIRVGSTASITATPVLLLICYYYYSVSSSSSSSSYHYYHNCRWPPRCSSRCWRWPGTGPTCSRLSPQASTS